jgi:hypothetical protein
VFDCRSLAFGKVSLTLPRCAGLDQHPFEPRPERFLADSTRSDIACRHRKSSQRRTTTDRDHQLSPEMFLGLTFDVKRPSRGSGRATENDPHQAASHISTYVCSTTNWPHRQLRRIQCCGLKGFEGREASLHH